MPRIVLSVLLLLGSLGSTGPMAAQGLAGAAEDATVPGSRAARVASGQLVGGSAGPVADPDAALVQSSAGASDDRWLVSATGLRERPFRGIVWVSIGPGSVCTGFVVAPRKVVTAAHCMVRNAAEGDFRFRSGLPGNLLLRRGYSEAVGGSTYAACPVIRVWAHPRFIRSGPDDTRYGSRSHDYAVLTVPVSCSYPRNSVLPLWATSAFDGQLPVGRQVRLAGYPADPRFEGMDGRNLWRSQGKILASSDPAVLAVTGFVAQGMSGAPVWRSFKRDSPCGRAQCVVGLITECAVNRRGLCKLGDSPRRAVRITPSVKKTIRDR